MKAIGKRDFLEHGHFYEVVGDAVVAVGPDLEILYFNRSFATMTPHNRRELGQMKLTDCLRLDAPGIDEMIRQVAGSGSGSSWREVRGTDGHAEAVSLWVWATPLLEEDGSHGGVLFALKDLSLEEKIHGKYREKLETEKRDKEKLAELTRELEKTNRELMAVNQELKSLDQLKDDLLSLISHELKTPIAGMIGCLEILTTMDPEPAERDEYMGLLAKECTHMRLLVEKIVDMVEIEKDNFAMDVVDFEARPLALESVRRALEGERETGSIDIEVEEFADVLVRGDEHNTAKVLDWIVDNAIRFNREGGWVKIRGALAAAGNGPAEFVVSVADSGVGIREEDYPRVFNKFEMVESVMNHKQGLGLSMPLARRIVEKQGGRIWFESVFEQGTVFRFSIPLAARP